MRCHVISLERRPERLREFYARFPVDWPLAMPQRFVAVDGQRTGPPPWWTSNAGAWGCYLSHLAIIEDHARQFPTEPLLVFEDDAFPLGADAGSRARQFVAALPDDCDLAYLGGQLLLASTLSPRRVNDEVFCVRDVNRMHAYMISPAGLPKVRDWLASPKAWTGDHRHHCDYRLAELPSDRVYAPARWLLGQAAGTSDIRGDFVGERAFADPQELEMSPCP